MKQPFPWSDAFAVGDDELDDDHFSMVSLINRICLAVIAGRHVKTISLLNELQFVSEAHFRREEARLHAIGSEIDQHHLQTVVRTAIEQHAQEHQRCLGALHKLVDKWRTTSDGEGSMLCDKLKSWFIGHAVGSESQIKTILQSTRHLSDSR
jgi:hemerythrin-like metal-binding protein